MAENPNAFKHWFDEELINSMANELAETGPFDSDAFIGDCLSGLDGLELKDRVRSIAGALRQHLPDDYPSALARILAVLPPAKTSTDDVSEGFGLWPYCQFVEEYGLEHLRPSLDAMVELTQRFSAEFAIRPFLVRYPDQVLTRLMELTDHPNPHVRRWVSEGTRPRLPWGMRLHEFIEDPSPVVRLLEALRQDPEEYVRRSVANNLNDIAKDHPDPVVEIAARWSRDATDDELRMIKHALRTLVKRGNRDALATLGYGPVEVHVEGFEVSPTTIAIGEKVELNLKLRSLVEEPQPLLIDYIVHHQKANGSTSPRVFKWTKRELAGGELLSIKKRHSMRVVTTRIYYPGVHRIEVQLNGEVVAETSFDLTR